MRKTYRIIAAAVLACCVQFGAAAEGFEQDRFAIGFWVDPPADQLTPKRYEEIADAGFSVVIGMHPRSEEEIERQLRLCKRNGLKLIASRPPSDDERWANHAACWGYTLRDEPSLGDFAALAERADALRRRYPDRLPYVNLFPTYASAEQLGTETYEEHVRQFMEIYRPEVLSMDHYPYMTPESDTRDDYCENLAVMRAHAMEAGVPFWNFFNIMPFGPHLDPTEAQVRWQVNASLCYGAKGVLYFCYWSPRGDDFAKGGAILNAVGTRTRHYDEAQRINHVLQQWGPTLMRLTSDAVLQVSGGDKAIDVLAGQPLANISEGNYRIGIFHTDDGTRAVLLMNDDYAYAAWPTVEFESDAVQEVSPRDGAIAPVQDNSPDMPGLQLSLDAGAARLFLLKSR
ncbi:MAG: hypothetical protein GC168_18880 [Candidatus Hydrogenedens sp.]|nr:hypothetical protein [Candidatus Hydrogenedens sp.]